MTKQPTRTRTVYDEKGNPIKVDATVFADAVSSAGSKREEAPANQTPQVVYMARPHEPLPPEISPAIQQKHEESVKRFPYLNLSDGEYVISAVQRHPIGLIAIWGVTALLIGLFCAGIVTVMGDIEQSALLNEASTPALAMVLLGLIAFTFMGGIIATVIYESNRFFLTNESVIQHIQTGLFAKKEQTISLGNIEDASFKQNGVIEHILGYGSLRLSTEGDETTYRFSFVNNPDNQIALLNNAVEAFKNGRPVDPNEDQ